MIGPRQALRRTVGPSSVTDTSERSVLQQQGQGTTVTWPRGLSIPRRPLEGTKGTLLNAVPLLPWSITLPAAQGGCSLPWAPKVTGPMERMSDTPAASSDIF